MSIPGSSLLCLTPRGISLISFCLYASIASQGSKSNMKYANLLLCAILCTLFISKSRSNQRLLKKRFRSIWGQGDWSKIITSGILMTLVLYVYVLTGHAKLWLLRFIGILKIKISKFCGSGHFYTKPDFAAMSMHCLHFAILNMFHSTRIFKMHGL